MRSNLNELSLNIIMRMISGRRYYGEDVENGEEVKDIIEQMFAKSGASHVTDYVPFLKRIGYGGYERSVMMLGMKMDQVLEGIIDENRKESRNSMVDHLLSLQKSQPDYYTDSIIKGLMVVCFSYSYCVSCVDRVYLYLSITHCLRYMIVYLNTQIHVRLQFPCLSFK